MTAIFVLTLVMIAISWLFHMINMIFKIYDACGTETGLYLLGMIGNTIKTAILIVFVCILYAN
jgi:hypothetical protein